MEEDIGAARDLLAAPTSSAPNPNSRPFLFAPLVGSIRIEHPRIRDHSMIQEGHNPIAHKEPHALHGGSAPHRTSQTANPAFTNLFQSIRPQLWLIAAAITGNRSEADDILQDAAILGLSQFHTFTPGTDFARWMGQITRHLSLNAKRKQRRTTTYAAHSTRAKAALAHTDQPHSALQADLDSLLLALNMLDENARTCLLLRVVGGLSYQSISAITDLSEGTAMSHVFRSRKRLRALLLNPEDNR